MGAITGRQIVDKASKLLLNTGYVRWKLSELLGWLNSGFSEIVIVKPSAYVVTGPVQLVAGAKQALPADAVALVELVRNLGANGDTPGAAITYVERKILDTHYPQWHTAEPSAVVDFFTHDTRNPRTFYVSPPSNGANRVEMVRSALPPALTNANADPEVAAANALAQAIPLDDVYENALVDYVLFRSYAKDQNLAASDSKAAAYYAIFLKSLGMKATQEIVDSAMTRHAAQLEG